ncbi:hypothetical protein BC567DRAFT_88341 [Phyllosticta citribraziliensis]
MLACFTSSLSQSLLTTFFSCPGRSSGQFSGLVPMERPPSLQSISVSLPPTLSFVMFCTGDSTDYGREACSPPRIYRARALASSRLSSQPASHPR